MIYEVIWFCKECGMQYVAGQRGYGSGPDSKYGFICTFCGCPYFYNIAVDQEEEADPK